MLGVHPAHEMHVGRHLVVVVTAGMSELVVDDGNAVAVDDDSVGAKDTGLSVPFVLACNAALIIYYVLFFCKRGG